MNMRLFLVIFLAISACLVWPAVEYVTNAWQALALCVLYGVFIFAMARHLDRYMKE